MTEVLKLEDLESQLDQFEEILLSLTHPELTALNEEDIELLSQIRQKLELLPTTGSFDLTGKSKISPIITPTSRKLGDKFRSISQKMELTKDASPKFISRSELNTTQITIPYVKREENDSFKFEEILMSLRYFSEIIQEKTLHCERFRIASINSDISIKTADHFIHHFTQIIFDTADVLFFQKSNKSIPVTTEVYGYNGGNKQVFFT